MAARTRHDQANAGPFSHRVRPRRIASGEPCDTADRSHSLGRQGRRCTYVPRNEALATPILSGPEHPAVRDTLYLDLPAGCRELAVEELGSLEKTKGRTTLR